MRRKLRWVVGVVALLALASLAWMEVFVKVGRVNYLIHHEELASVVAQAQQAFPIPADAWSSRNGERVWIPPNTSFGMEMVLVDGELRRDEHIAKHGGGVSLLRRSNGRLVVTIPRSGYLRTQGYVYAEDPAVTQVTDEGFPLAESTTFVKVDDRWCVTDQGR